MFKFEVGKSYGAGDTATPHITILKRTAKTCVVTNEEGNTWRMRLKEYEHEDTEALTDSAVPESWRECYTWYAKYEDREGK